METDHFFSHGKKESPSKDFFELNAWAQNYSVIGVDEVGRGCLAGPVVAAAVVLKPYAKHPLIRDSKTLSPSQLQVAYLWLINNAIISIGIIPSWIIDTVSIYQATQKAMRQAIIGILAQPLQLPCKNIVIDAMPLTLAPLNIPIISFNKGETYSRSIAAASIAAKVSRDRLMRQLSNSFPAYGFDAHKGYGTSQHCNAIAEKGLSFIHRTSFNIPGEKYEKQTTIFC